MADDLDLARLRELEAGQSSPHAPPDAAAATSRIRSQQSERQPGGSVNKGPLATSCAYDDVLDQNSIRLMRITRDPMTGDAECWTEKFSLQKLPPYTALSYACGPPPANFALKLNGRDDWTVRENLFRFLRHYLQMNWDTQEWLWIDAICINHENASEQTHQVQRMAEIYSKASQALIWLGPAFEQSDDAMEALPRFRGHKQSLETDPCILALIGICSRPYWHRLWVFQELKLAKRKYLMCGSQVIHWQHFESFMLLLDESFNDSTPLALSDRTRCIIKSAAMRMIRLTRRPTGTPLWDLLNMSGDLECEKSRDRVYALCGLATTEAAKIKIDYSIDIPMLMNDVLRCHIAQVPEMSILDVTSACKELERIFRTKPGTMFEHENSRNRHTGRAGLLYQRLRTHPIDTPGMTLDWATHHGHARVQELIEMAHRLRRPFYRLFCLLQAVGTIVGFSLAPKPGHTSFEIILGLLVMNLVVLIISYEGYEASRLSKLGVRERIHNEWKQGFAWPLVTALEYLLTWRYGSWVPFVMIEVPICIAMAPVRFLLFLFLRAGKRGRNGYAPVPS